MRELLDADDAERNAALGTPVRTQYRKLLPRTLIFVFALLLLVEAASFAWGCSYSRGTQGSVALTQGQLCVIWFSSTYSPRLRVVHPVGWRAGSVQSEPRGPRWADQLPRWKATGSIRFVIIPFWALILATGAAAFWTRRRSRHLPGHCPTCHYDLRAIPPSNGKVSCPECGNSSTPTTPSTTQH